ncbi:hypothetical protein DPEC_G00154200 [Dallia pectoralis]|uniref:Uncharacterized protein n=1 Tax=Dallia pectoralis TaxID=75939 RepID=A0ACC2GKK1_DALPE|nr:hypothetical protein DPEC_G00154200 [Dallia pectoralis]
MQLPGCVAELQEAVAWVKENMGLFTERVLFPTPDEEEIEASVEMYREASDPEDKQEALSPFMFLFCIYKDSKYSWERCGLRVNYEIIKAVRGI